MLGFLRNKQYLQGCIDTLEYQKEVLELEKHILQRQLDATKDVWRAALSDELHKNHDLREQLKEALRQRALD